MPVSESAPGSRCIPGLGYSGAKSWVRAMANDILGLGPVLGIGIFNVCAWVGKCLGVS